MTDKKADEATSKFTPEEFQQRMMEYEAELFNAMKPTFEHIFSSLWVKPGSDGEDQIDDEMRIAATIGAVIRHAAHGWTSLMLSNPREIHACPEAFTRIANAAIISSILDAAQDPESGVVAIPVTAEQLREALEKARAEAEAGDEVPEHTCDRADPDPSTVN